MLTGLSICWGRGQALNIMVLQGKGAGVKCAPFCEKCKLPLPPSHHTRQNPGLLDLFILEALEFISSIDFYLEYIPVQPQSTHP